MRRSQTVAQAVLGLDDVSGSGFLELLSDMENVAVYGAVAYGHSGKGEL